MQRYPSCFNGAGEMDTTCSAIVNETTLNIYASVSNWEGFQYFHNLQNLTISLTSSVLPVLPSTLISFTINGGQNVTALPAFPAGLQIFRVNNCTNLLSLPTLPAALVELDCSNCRNIASLPALPVTLKILNCSENKLTSLPTLPATLETLDCSFNDSLAVLPALPGSLKVLDCQMCNISSLGATLPSSLTFLDFNYNRVTNLPTLPAGLVTLYGVRNQVSSLPSFPATLTTIYMNSNSFSTVPTLPQGLNMFGVGGNLVSVLPSLPNSITYMDCGDNLLTSLPALPTSLKTFYCHSNQLTTLPAIPPRVRTIWCYGNQLTSLPSLPDTLDALRCAGNNLVSLPTLPPHLTRLECNDNELAYLPELPESLNGLWCQKNNMTCMPVLPNGFIEIFMDSAINCIPNSPSSYSIMTYGANGFYINMYYSNQNHYPLCSAVNNSNHCDAFPLMQGYVYNDNNNNGIRDNNEPYRANIRVTLSDGTFTTTNNNGYYEIAADSIGNYILTCNAPNYFASVPPSYAFNFNNYDTLVTNNFALQATTIADSLSISVTPVQWAARPGFPMTYVISYENSGTTTLAPSVFFNYINSQLLYDSSSNAAVVNNINFLRLDETAMVPGERRSFISYFHVNPTAVLGDTIHIVTSIYGGSASARDSAATRIRGSFDPNDKSATPALTPEQVANGDYISYNIRFQNTGTDTAFNVIITDTLSSFLQASSLKVVNASHPCKTTVQGNVVVFEFLNILLPDSNVNEMKSHGFISFKIKPQSNVVLNTSIPNYAAIYFDYNLPVNTNTAVTQIQNAIVVPLKLLSFNVERQTKGTANAYWTTSNEDKVKDFSVEVSTNAKDYTGIASEISKGGQYNSYTRPVAVPASNVVYYRLKITDIDGRFYYGPVVTLRSNAESAGFSFQNNPVKDKLIISIEDASLINTMARIINAQGSVVQKIYFNNDPQVVNLNTLPAGTYVLETIKGSRQFVLVK
ncbi:MAG: SdrD B-like domain-containing protein [Ferruginibacter sp.]